MNRLTDEEIEQTFSDLGLSDDLDRQSLLAKLGALPEVEDQPPLGSHPGLFPVITNESTAVASPQHG